MYAPQDTLNLPIRTQRKTVQKRVFQRLISCQPSFSLHMRHSAQRQEVEQYIHSKYQCAYHAELQHYMPYLLSMESCHNISSVMGFRPALAETLFVEQYISDSIETVIAAQTQADVNRNTIVEIGNLAAVKQGSSQLLMIIIVALLYQQGYHWSVFSATEDVRKIMNKLGFTTYTLCPAKSEKIHNDVKQWGSYYHTQPYVMVGDLRDTYKKLQQHRLFNMALKYFDKNIVQLSQVFQDAQ